MFAVIIMACLSLLAGFLFSKSHPAFKVTYWDGDAEITGTLRDGFTAASIPNLEHNLTLSTLFQTKRDELPESLHEAVTMAGEYYAAQCGFYCALDRRSRSLAHSISNAGAVAFIVVLFIRCDRMSPPIPGIIVFTACLFVFAASVVVFCSRVFQPIQLLLSSEDARREEAGTAAYYSALSTRAVIPVVAAKDKINDATDTAEFCAWSLCVLSAFLFY